MPSYKPALQCWLIRVYNPVAHNPLTKELSMFITSLGKKVLGCLLVIIGAVLTTLVLSSGGEYYRLIATVATAVAGPVLIWMGHDPPK